MTATMNADITRAQLERLQTLLCLSQQGPLAYQLRTAMEASLDERGEFREGTVQAAVEMLGRLHAWGEHVAVAQADLSKLAWGPLWVGEAVARAMRPLAGHADAVLVVTGLSRHVCPISGRWSRACRADYDSMRAQVEHIAARYLGPRARLRILFV